MLKLIPLDIDGYVLCRRGLFMSVSHVDVFLPDSNQQPDAGALAR